MCSIEACGRKSVARGWCQRHYARWARYGDPTFTRIASKYDSAMDRLRRYADLEADADVCWPWRGHHDEDGYGSIRHPGGRSKAHVLSWELLNGPVPAGLVVCHRCDNPPCVNPAHLFVGTPADNTADMDSKGRRVVQRGEQHPHAKLTAAAVRTIRDLVGSGATQASVASRFGVSRRTVGKAVSQQTWKEVA